MSSGFRNRRRQNRPTLGGEIDAETNPGSDMGEEESGILAHARYAARTIDRVEARRKEEQAKRAPPTPEQVVAFVNAVLERQAAYAWPVVSSVLASRKTPHLTRRGRRAHAMWRKENVTSVDPRAVEGEMLRHLELWPTSPNHEERGMSYLEFAEFFGMDRRTVGKHIVDIPPGPCPPLPPGTIPGRRAGSVTRIFLRDFLGMPNAQTGENNACDQRAPSVPDYAGHFHRQIDRVRRRGAADEREEDPPRGGV